MTIGGLHSIHDTTQGTPHIAPHSSFTVQSGQRTIVSLLIAVKGADICR